MPHLSRTLINDEDIADLLAVSRSWVRQQRFKRRHGLDHSFDIDPIRIGSLPRYRYEDVIAWLDKQEYAIAVSGHSHVG